MICFMKLIKKLSKLYRIGIHIPYRIFCQYWLHVTHVCSYELVYHSLVRILSRCSSRSRRFGRRCRRCSRRRRSFGCRCFCRGYLGCLLSFQLFSLILLHSQLLCLSILLFYCRIAVILVLVWPVAEPVTNVIAEITCTQTNTKRRKKPCKPVLSRSGKEAGQSIGTEASSSTEQDVLENLRINSRLLIQTHHLEICLFIHVYLT